MRFGNRSFITSLREVKETRAQKSLSFNICFITNPVPMQIAKQFQIHQIYEKKRTFLQFTV